MIQNDNCLECDAVETMQSVWIEQTAARARDRFNLPKPKWRAMLTALAGPALRLHRFRNLRTSMFYDATCQLDCHKWD